MTNWIKNNIQVVLSIAMVVFTAGLLVAKLREVDTRQSAIEARQDKQDDYNGNTDQKIDDLKAWVEYQKGYQQAVKDLKTK